MIREKFAMKSEWSGKSKRSVRHKVRQFIRLLAAVVCLIYILFAGISLYYHYVSIDEINTHFLEERKSELENDLYDARQFLLNLYTNNAEFEKLRKETNTARIYRSESDLLQLLRSKTSVTNEKCLYFISKDIKNGYYSACSNYYDNDTKTKLDRAVKLYLDHNEAANGTWCVTEYEKQGYLILLFGKDEIIIGAAMDLEYYADRNNIGGTIIFAEGDNLLNNRQFMEEHKLSLQHMRSSLRYYIAGNALEIADITIYDIIPQSRVLHLLTVYFLIGSVSMAVIFLLAKWVCGLFDKAIVYPVEQMSKMEQELQKGAAIESDIFRTDIDEYDRINQNMVSLVRQVSELQRKSAERELAYQKSRLQYYQLQTEPHFFLNCLKNIYAMAENRSYDKLQYMIKIISDHFRYVFRGNFEDISLAEEIEEAERYFHLCRLSSAVPMCFVKEVDESVLDRKIPVLLIQIFVENSIKYAKIDNRILQITLAVRRDENENVHIEIRDNGKGYPPEYVNGDFLQEAGGNGHIGIRNVMDRIRFVYGDKAEIILANREEGGAFTDIVIAAQR